MADYLMEGAEETSAQVDTRITLEKVAVNVGILSPLKICPCTWDRKVGLKPIETLILQDPDDTPSEPPHQ